MRYEQIWQDVKPHTLKFSVLLLLSLVISFVIPIKRSSRYLYSNDKPWQGDLLTAPYDFPILKSEEQLQKERDSISQKSKPVYILDRDLGLLMIQGLRDEYQAHLTKTVPSEYFAYLNDKLESFYSTGIIPARELKRLRLEKKFEIFLQREGNELESVPITSLRTMKEVHEDIVQSLPHNLEPEVLSRLNVNDFLKENVVFNKELTERLLDDALSNISKSTNMVQAGQRIVDKGEIVTWEIYNLLRSLEKEQEKRLGESSHDHQSRVGFFLIISTAFFVLALALLFIANSFVVSYKNISLIFISVSFFVITTAYVSFYGFFSVYAIPYVMVVILLRTFMDSYTSLLSFLVTVLLSALFVVEPLSFFVVQLLSGVSALIALQKLTNRGKMIRAAFVVYLVYSITYFAMNQITSGSLDKAYWQIQLVFGVNLILLNFTYILSAVVERVFGYVSNVSLVELSDNQSPLLKELSETAPGTFQHSLQVSILAVDATDKIGGDVQLIRAGAMYHDIGKIKNPAYFTENQGGTNPHDLLTEEESVAIIVRHVTDGIALAQKHGLPAQIIDFIRTHHGDSLVRYFYNTYCNQHPGEEVDKSLFSYPGPKPFTREQGILMLADATEASSRSLKDYSVEALTAHVVKIVDSIVAEGLLTDTPLSFKDIQIIKKSFTSKLITMYHSRISYPDKK